MADYLNTENDPSKSFATSEIDLCVNSNDFLIGISRKNSIRIKADGHDSSAIEILETDSEENKCN